MTEMTPELLAAIRERDALVVPRFLSPQLSYAEWHQLQAEMDRRALLAEVDRLRRWQAEALPVSEGLQELGQALGLRLGDSITGTAALAAVNKLKAENKHLQGELRAALGAP